MTWAGLWDFSVGMFSEGTFGEGAFGVGVFREWRFVRGHFM